jgi:hypothetical protein
MLLPIDGGRERNGIEVRGDVRSDIERTYRALADEHHEIMSVVERLEQRHSLAQLVPMLEELHALLINHFAHEQFPGGLYESLGAYGSAHHEDLRVSVNEHCVILSSVRGVLERARLANETQAAQILNEVAAAIKSVHQHEHKEHRLTEKLLHG